MIALSILFAYWILVSVYAIYELGIQSMAINWESAFRVYILLPSPVVLTVLLIEYWIL